MIPKYHGILPRATACLPIFFSASLCLFKQQRGRKEQAGFTFKPQSVQKERTLVHGHMLDSFFSPPCNLPSAFPPYRKGLESTSIDSITNATRWKWFSFQLGSWSNPLPTKGQPGRKLRDRI